MTKSLLICLLLINVFTTLTAQISQGGSPISWQNNNIENPKILEFKNIDVPKVAKNEIPKHGSFTFAELIEIAKPLKQIGSLTLLPNGDKLWMLQIKSAGAYSLNTIFDRYVLPPGAELYIYSADHSFVLGAFTYENNKSYGSLATAAVPGDEIVIEYFEPADAAFDGELVVGTVGHDYLNIFGNKGDDPNQFGASGPCNIDINCEEGKNWQAHKRSVVRIISDGRGLCSGVVLNNINQDKKPFILTAAHCFDKNKNYSPENSVYYFNYESPECKGSDGSQSQTVSGSTLMADKEKNNGYLDFSLVKLSNSIPWTYQAYYAGWDARDNTPESTVCIHHPWGDVKKISVDNDAAGISTHAGYGYDDNTFWWIKEWDAGMTQGGSSGSPIFDQNGRVVGVLSGGDASVCSDDPVNDYYQMFSVSYDRYSADSTQLKAWLDPNNTGIEYIDGYDSSTSISGEIAEIKKLNISPNPVNNVLNIELKTAKIFSVAYIFDTTGKLVKTHNNKYNKGSIDVSELKNGLYLLLVKANGISYTERFIKQAK